MNTDQRLKGLPKREQRGSRARCILATDGARDDVAPWLTKLVQPYAVVEPTRIWMPDGLRSTAEAKLGESHGFLSLEQREAVTGWWLAKPAGANTPNWDIAATATIDGRDGIVLVEAKAHSNELKVTGKNPTGEPENHRQIENAIADANRNLNSLMPGWNLSADLAYQLANRFAWTWKIASLGIPTILVYLGFLRADEMLDQGEPFADAGTWEAGMLSHCRKLVPDAAWNTAINIRGTQMRAMIRSSVVTLDEKVPI